MKRLNHRVRRECIDVAQLEDARMILEDAGLRVVGLHAHIGSGIAEVTPLAQSAARLVELADGFPDLRWLNFGGGIGIPYRPGDLEFPLEEYGAQMTAIAGPVLRKRGLTAILEPGRYVMAPAGLLLATVTSRKISAGTVWLGCDTGFNHLARPSRYGSYHHILNATRGDDRWLREQMLAPPYDDESGAIVAGNICESGDVFTKEEGELRPRRLPETRVGDLLAFCDAGAYGFSMASHYNTRMLPPEVMIESGQATLIRRRQTMTDLLLGQEDPAPAR